MDMWIWIFITQSHYRHTSLFAHPRTPRDCCLHKCCVPPPPPQWFLGDPGFLGPKYDQNVWHQELHCITCLFPLCVVIYRFGVLWLIFSWICIHTCIPLQPLIAMSKICPYLCSTWSYLNICLNINAIHKLLCKPWQCRKGDLNHMKSNEQWTNTRLFGCWLILTTVDFFLHTLDWHKIFLQLKLDFSHRLPPSQVNVVKTSCCAHTHTCQKCLDTWGRSHNVC